jgi:hypothetical protein
MFTVDEFAGQRRAVTVGGWPTYCPRRELPKSGHWIASPENAEAIFSIEDT